MNELVVVPTWKEKELIVPFEFFRRKFVCNMIQWDINNIYDLRITKTKYYTELPVEDRDFRGNVKNNQRYHRKCLRKYVVLKNQSKLIYNYISGLKNARLCEEYNLDRFVSREIIYEKNNSFTYGIVVYKIKESYVSYLLQRKLDSKFCDLLQREFNNICSNADNVSFDNYIDSWAKRLLIESMVKPDGL